MSNILKRVLYERSSPVVIKYRPPVEPVAEPVEVLVELPPEPKISLEAVRSEAEAIFAQAEMAATRCIAEAEARAKELTGRAEEDGRSEGYQAGFSQGNEAALAEIKETMELTLAKADRMIKAAEEEARQMIVGAEHTIVEIAMAVAGKVLARAVEEDPATILPVVKEALARVRDQDHIVIRVNPDDYDMVLTVKRELQLMVGREHAVTVTADDIVAQGGCVVETALGTVDAKLDTKLEMVYKAIKETLP